MTEPFDVLCSHVRGVALLERPETDPDDLIASITGAAPANTAVGSTVVSFRSPRRRRWLVATSVIAVVAVGGAGVAAFRGARPERPQEGVVCRASLDNSTVIVVEPTADPIGACGALWVEGDLPNVDGPRVVAAVPRLIACVGTGEAVEVVPVPELTSCAALGLADADVVAAAKDPLVLLQTTLADRVNGSECRSADAVAATVMEVLKELSLDQWKIDVRDPNATCALAFVQPETSSVVVFLNPSPT